jgi:hypothetical protein
METMNETTVTTGDSSAKASEATGGGEASKAIPEGTKEGKGNDGGAPSPAGTTSTEQQAAQAAPYTPNFKFKVKDKELEFDDFVKPIVKNKELEAKFRDMYEKAYGLDEVKSSRDQVKQQLQEWQNKFGEVETSLKTLGGYLKTKDYGKFFDLMQIPTDDIIKYAINEVQYRELPPEQRQAIDAQRQQRTELEQAQMLNQSFQQQLATLSQQQVTMELNQELSKPDVVSIASAYDTRTGKPGSFKTEVIKRGQYYEAVHKISPPASQLVAELVSLIGSQASGTQTPEANSQGQSGQTSQQQKPVIPAFQSSGAKSPTKKVINSVEDLRKLRQNLTT